MDRSLFQKSPIECVYVCLVCLILCDLETSTIERPRSDLGRYAKIKKLVVQCVREAEIYSDQSEPLPSK
jgi:hypothetical protein